MIHKIRAPNPQTLSPNHGRLLFLKPELMPMLSQIIKDRRGNKDGRVGPGNRTPDHCKGKILDIPFGHKEKDDDHHEDGQRGDQSSDKDLRHASIDDR